MKQDIWWERLAKYFAGELTKEETRKIEKWINASPARAQYVEQLYKIWQESGVPPHKIDLDVAWDTLSDNMSRLEESAEEVDQILSHAQNKAIKSVATETNYHQPTDIKRHISIAAAVVAIFITGLLTYLNHGFDPEKNTEAAKKQLVAQKGERSTYTLIDGSKVVLHAGSRLEVPTQYNVEKREVFLEGEAYFEIAHDSTNPFIVYTQGAYTRVLGTKFLVQAWPNPKKETKVVVGEGKVAFGDNYTASKGNEVFVTRNQKAILAIDKAPEVTDVKNVSRHLGWIHGRLIFKNRPLSEIINRLEYWYALEIQLENESIGKEKLTAEINYRQPMDEVLKSIALSLDLEIQKEDRTVILRQKKLKE